VTLISVDGESSDNFTTNNKTPEIKFKFLDPEKFYAYCKVVISSLDTATIHVSPSLLAQNDTVMNFTSPALSEGNWTVYVECNDSTDVGMSETRTLYVNKLPEVQLIHPVDNTLNLGGLVDFTYNVSDNESSLDCSFYSNLTGIWDWNGSQSITPPSLSFFTRNLTDGVYVWNVECFDGYQSAFAPNNYTIKVDSNTPDLAISEADVSFSSDAPVEGNLVWVTVTVWNNGIGNVTNVTVEFILDGSSRDNNTISVPGNSSNNTVFSWTAVEGSRSLNFTVDPEEHIEEFDEDNNKVHISKTVAPTTTLPPSTDGGDPGGGINLPKPLPSCFDGIQNCHDGDCEEGVDCGGPCKSCMSCSDGIQNQGPALLAMKPSHPVPYPLTRPQP
jgi:hypothetical protein